jgi:hypothetical protein
VSENDLFLRYGRKYPLQLVIFEPLFEEANRCRRLINSVALLLEACEIGTVIPHLPGTGESMIDIASVRYADWRPAAAAIIQDLNPVTIASFRGGSLIDDCGTAKGWWRFSPETGARTVRDLRRTQLSGGDTALFAGHALSDAFLTDLEAASPAQVTPLRTVTLESDAMTADIKLAGSPLWRRAEPGEDGALAAAIADDLAIWVRTCAAS